MRAILSLLAAVSAFAQTPFSFWPGAVYDPAIPTVEKVLGYEAGRNFASHSDIVRYFEALAAAAPGRMKVFEHGRTWDGRKLIHAVIGSEANIRRIPEIQAAMQKLADPRKTQEAEAQRLIGSTPAVIWLGHGVHGNEISSCDAAGVAAYHLLAAKNDPLVAKVLNEVVVIIDPTQNPDGRMRFIHNFQQNVGLEPDATPLAAERNEPWPGGRTNHYLFDMNRDWFALTQPETQGRIRTLREWLPVVAVDLHEMGSESTYYFAPEADPFNPHLTKEQRTSLDWFGKNNAKYFDQRGYAYFTREVYDAFYPGYGASWPAYYGSIAMTYENASVRGLVYRRGDGSVYDYRDSVRKHFTAQMGTCETAANYRKPLLENFWNYQKTAVEEGRNGAVKAYVLPRRGDVAAVDKLAGLLVAQGVEVHRAAAAFQSFPAGSYVVQLAQPAKRLVSVLLEKDVEMDKKFAEEQERRRAKALGDEIYDVTAWSLPLLYNVECVPQKAAVNTPLEIYKPAAAKPPAPAKASVAYLVPWTGRAAGVFLAAALRRGLTVLSPDKEFVQNGRTFPRGTLVVPVKDNPANVHETVLQIAGEAEVVATDTGWVEGGINFGSRYVNKFKKASIALLWDRPVSGLSAGSARFVLERQFGYPVSVIRTASLGAADLSQFDVIILPGAQGSYGESLIGVLPRLKAWVSAGGTLIGIEEGVSYLAGQNVGLLATSAESLFSDGKKTDPPKPENGRIPGRIIADEKEYLSSIKPDRAVPDAVQGVLAMAKTDDDHWLTAGVGATVHTLVQGRNIFAPLKLDKGVNAAWFPEPSQLLAAGFMWPENRKQLAFKPLVMVQREGRGHVVGFTFDPNFRAYLDGMNLFFLNAVFRGPAHAR
jgi:hypothetical protein